MEGKGPPRQAYLLREILKIRKSPSIKKMKFRMLSGLEHALVLKDVKRVERKSNSTKLPTCYCSGIVYAIMC